MVESEEGYMCNITNERWATSIGHSKAWFMIHDLNTHPAISALASNSVCERERLHPLSEDLISKLLNYNLILKDFES